MQVNFTGISNSSYLSIINPLEHQTVYAFSSLLKDDRQGEDYTDFVYSLRKSNQTENYINPVNSKMVSIVINKNEDQNTGISSYVFRLNGNELPINTKTMPIFDYLAKLTRRISGTPTEKLIANKDYIYSDEIRFGLFPNVDLADFLTGGSNNEEKFLEYAKIINDPQHAKNGAKIINANIQGAMVDYFA